MTPDTREGANPDFTIQITATGPQGCGKTRAITALVDAIVKNPDFEWLDGRFLEGYNDELQIIELRLK